MCNGRSVIFGLDECGYPTGEITLVVGERYWFRDSGPLKEGEFVGVLNDSDGVPTCDAVFRYPETGIVVIVHPTDIERDG